MSTNPVRDAAEIALELAEREASKALENLEKARARMDAVAGWPDEPEVGAVIKFTVQYHGGETVYTYVAFRSPMGSWYITGAERAHSWKTLTDVMMRDVTARQLGISFYEFGKGKWRGRKP